MGEKNIHSVDLDSCIFHLVDLSKQLEYLSGQAYSDWRPNPNKEFEKILLPLDISLFVAADMLKQDDLHNPTIFAIIISMT